MEKIKNFFTKSYVKTSFLWTFLTWAALLAGGWLRMLVKAVALIEEPTPTDALRIAMTMIFMAGGIVGWYVCHKIVYRMTGGIWLVTLYSILALIGMVVFGYFQDPVTAFNEANEILAAVYVYVPSIGGFVAYVILKIKEKIKETEEMRRADQEFANKVEAFIRAHERLMDARKALKENQKGGEG